MKIIETIHQGHEEWDNLRSVRPTASEFGKIWTGSGKLSAQRERYMRQLAVARKYKILPSFTGNKWTERGTLLEPEARQMFIDMTGYQVREVGFIQSEQCIAGGSPDGLIYDASGVPVSGIEIKCYKDEKHSTIMDKGVLPTENKPQVHGHLWLSGFASWVFIPYNPDCIPHDIAAIEVTPDGYTADLGAAVLEFCRELEERADEFVADYEARMAGTSLLESLPVTSASIQKVGGLDL